MATSVSHRPPGRAAPARGSSDSELTLKPRLPPRHSSVLGFALATSTREHGASVGTEEAHLPPSGGKDGPSLMWLSRAHWYYPPPKSWLGPLPTIPPMVRPEAAQPLEPWPEGSRQVAAGCPLAAASLAWDGSGLCPPQHR